jgi:hypothetical protein
MNNSVVTINFDSPHAAKHFASWLSGQGEQDYWIWMEEREQETSDVITARRFDFDWKSDNPVITAPCERMDKE